jgi:hypothetical protein
MAARAKKPKPTPRYVVTHWYATDTALSYDHQLHDGEELPVAPGRALREAMLRAGVEDGDEIEISVTKTGQRPYGSRRFVLVRTGIYEREPRESNV